MMGSPTSGSRARWVPGVQGGYTIHYPSSERMTIYDAAMRYKSENVPQGVRHRLLARVGAIGAKFRPPQSRCRSWPWKTFRRSRGRTDQHGFEPPDH
jgi:hypothetical protein